MLLCDFPFNGADVKSISNSVRTKQPDFSHPEFKACSKECLHLISQLLEKDKNVRISATDALSHPWFKDIQDIQVKDIPFEKTINSFET